MPERPYLGLLYAENVLFSFDVAQTLVAPWLEDRPDRLSSKAGQP